MEENVSKHLVKLPLDAINESVEASPQVGYTNEEIESVLKDLKEAVEKGTYKPCMPTVANPSLSDDYLFDQNDERFVLNDLTKDNFVGKVRDLSKGSHARTEQGYPLEFLYVFKYPCRLVCRESDKSSKEE